VPQLGGTECEGSGRETQRCEALPCPSELAALTASGGMITYTYTNPRFSEEIILCDMFRKARLVCFFVVAFLLSLDLTKIPVETRSVQM